MTKKIAEEVQKTIENHIIELWKWLESLGVTEATINDYYLETETEALLEDGSNNVMGKIKYTIRMKNDEKRKILWCKTI